MRQSLRSYLLLHNKRFGDDRPLLIRVIRARPGRSPVRRRVIRGSFLLLLAEPLESGTQKIQSRSKLPDF